MNIKTTRKDKLHDLIIQVLEHGPLPTSRIALLLNKSKSNTHTAIKSLVIKGKIKCSGTTKQNFLTNHTMPNENMWELTNAL